MDLRFLKAKLYLYRILRKRWAGPAAGALIGLPGGGIGVAIGVILGYFLQELYFQLSADRDTLRYYTGVTARSPYEKEAGLAAFCGLAIWLVYYTAEEADGGSAADRTSQDDREPRTEGASQRAVYAALSAFPRGEEEYSRIESFCHIAASVHQRLDTDFLIADLMRKRETHGDIRALAEKLHAIAVHGGAQREAERIRSILDPSYRAYDNGGTALPGADPWLVLGLDKSVSTGEVKSTFRKLAVQFHPDELQILDEQRQEDAARAFMTIKEAYREIMRERRVSREENVE